MKVIKLFITLEESEYAVMNTERSVEGIDDIDDCVSDLIQPTIILEGKKCTDYDEEDTFTSINAICVDKGEQYVVVP